MAHPVDDVIVVIPGIMGSTLWRDGTPLWEPTGAAVVHALSTLFRSVTELRLPEGIGHDHPGDGVEAVALMPDVRLPFGVWTFDLGYEALLRFLRQTFALTEAPAGTGQPANLVVFPYDWRLSNRYNGERLRCQAERALDRWREQGGRYSDAQLVIVAHSMGGLVARWYLDHLGGAEVTRKLITLGTPHRGALSALDQLCNGVRKGVGPFKLNLTRFARSLPSLYELLPEYACIEGPSGLAKTTEAVLPALEIARVADAMEFHDLVDAGRAAPAGDYDLHPVCGFRQPTLVTARMEGLRVVAMGSIDGEDPGGDATVARLAAAPPDVRLDSATIRHVADNHAGLVHNRNVFDEIEGVLTASAVRYRVGEINLCVDIPEVLDPGEPLEVRASLPDGDEVALEAVVTDPDGRRVEVLRLRQRDGHHVGSPELPGPGVYRVTVQGAGAAMRTVRPITTAVLAWPPEADLGPNLPRAEA